MTRLEESRDRFAADWRDLQVSLQRETGREPHWSKSYLWPVLALAAGLAVGAGVWKRQSKKTLAR